MNAAKKTMIDIIRRMSDEKVMKVLSYAQFIENEEESELLLTEEEEEELTYILENDEKIDGNVIFNEIY